MGLKRIRLHAVLGDATALAPGEGAGMSGRLELGDGLLGLTRWFSGGLSSRRGWPLRTEALLGGEDECHVVLQLGDPLLSGETLCDEFSPLYGRGLPRALEAEAAVRANLGGLGLRVGTGCAVFTLAEPLPAGRRRKLGAWCRRLHWSPLFVVPQGDLEPPPPDAPIEAWETLASGCADLLRAAPSGGSPRDGWN